MRVNYSKLPAMAVLTKARFTKMKQIHFKITSQRNTTSFTSDAYYNGQRLYERTPLENGLEHYQAQADLMTNLKAITEVLIKLRDIYRDTPATYIQQLYSDVVTEVNNTVISKGYTTQTKIYSKSKTSISFFGTVITIEII